MTGDYANIEGDIIMLNTNHKNLSIKLLTAALVTVALGISLSMSAHAVPVRSDGGTCDSTGTERKEGKDAATGEKLSCEWETCSYTQCSTDGAISNCTKKTEYSNPTNCTSVRVTGPGRVRGTNRVRGGERKISAPVTITRPTTPTRNSAPGGQTLMIEKIAVGRPKGRGKSAFDEADAIFGKRSDVKATSGRPANRLRAPSNLVALKISRTNLVVAWHDNSTRELGVSLYSKQINTSSDRENFENITWTFVRDFEERIGTRVKNIGKRNNMVTGLTPGTNYCFRMQAYAGFDKTEKSGFSSVVCARTKNASLRHVPAQRTRN